MDKIINFIEKLATPLIITAIIGLVAMYIQVSVMDYKINELISWKASGERCTKEDCALMELRIQKLENRQIPPKEVLFRFETIESRLNKLEHK